MNTSLSLACCYFPTQIVMVDDQESVIDSLRFHLDANVKKFTNPTTALAQLINYSPTITEDLWLKPESTNDLVDGVHQQLALIDIKKIKSVAEKPSRLQDISVLVVDYQMPEMNGLELLEALQHKPFKKVLLTGEGDYQLAVDAFNQGLIDYFFRKDDNELPDKLRQVINELQRKYFFDLCTKTLTILSSSSPLFSDKVFSDFFAQELLSRNITEYYLLDTQGNYLLKNKTQKKSYFIIQAAENLGDVLKFL